MGFRNIAAVAAAALNPFSSSSKISSSVSYSNLPSVGNGSSHTWMDHGPSSAMRPSASLQDFSSYSRVTVDRDDATVLSSGDLHQAQSPLYHIHRDGSIFSSKFSKNSAAKSVQRRSSWWCKMVAVLLLLSVLGLTYFGVHWWRLHWRPQRLQYAVVLDCGSTGTRVQVYSWSYRGSSGSDQLPVVVNPNYPQVLKTLRSRKTGWKKAYLRMETEPGLDKLLRNESGVRMAVEPLLQWAKTQVAPSSLSSTPVFLLATAGMRRLDNDDAEWLLEKAWSIIEKSPFLSKRSWVKVISGVEEAYYGWVALNYKLGRLSQSPQQSTFGALDLGGSSLQVTFETDEVGHREYGLNLTVGSTEHHLYALSHAGFGLNDAFDKSVEALWSKMQSNNAADTRVRAVDVHHPCLHAGYQGPYKCSRCIAGSSAAVPDGISRTAPAGVHVGINLVGKPDWEACKALASSIIHNVSVSLGHDCLDPPCALGKHQPEPSGQFYALSGFFVVYKFFGLLPNANFDQLMAQGERFCRKPWKEAFDSVVPQPLVEHYCFRAPYVVALFQDGLHLKDEQIVVGSGDMTWTLGAALLEAGAFVPSKLNGAAPRRSGLTSSAASLSFLTADTGLLSFFLLLGMVLVLFAVTYLHNCASLFWRKPYLPLFTQSSLGTPRLPSSFLSPIRLVLNRGDNGVRNGEGKYKTPSSPAPGTLQDQQFRFGSLVSSVGKPIVGLTGPPLPGSGSYEKVSLKGSQLSSRRTQSRDDLIKYVRE